MRNWAGNHTYEAATILEAGSVDELQDAIRRAGRIRALGTRHSFNDLPDTSGELVSLRRLPRRFELDTAGASTRAATAARLTVDGGAAYGDLCGRLDAAGWALHNLASLPHIAVAGACATATHGSGDHHRSLSSAVVAIELIRGDGELERIEDPDGVSGAVVGLGTVGIVTALTLAVEPAFSMRQDVYEGVSFTTAADRLDEILSSADAVSLFTDWSEPSFHQVWLKRRATAEVAAATALELRPAALGEAAPAVVEHHPIRGMPAEACTPQLGSVGPWHERLPHFRLDHTPSAGDELQSEYIVPRRVGADALVALAGLREQLAPLTLASEVRSIAADDDWLSHSYGRDSVAFHFTWRRDWPSVRAVLPDVERVLMPFEVRPHWGKLFTLAPERVRAAYPRLDDFVGLARRMDPDGRFRNRFVDRYVFGDAAQ